MDKISKINNKDIVDTALNSSVYSETINESSNIITQTNSSYFKNPISSLFKYVKDKIISSINTTNDSLRNAFNSWLQGSTISTVDTTNKFPINSTALTTQLNTELTDKVTTTLLNKSLSGYVANDKKLASEVFNSFDFNKYLVTGFYRIDVISDYTNTPTGAGSYGQLIVSGAGKGTYTQIYTEFNSGKTYVRCFNDNLLGTDWYQLALKNDLDNKVTTSQLLDTLSSQNNHNIPRLSSKDITSYYSDGSIWDRLNGTNGFSLFEDIYVGDYIKMSRPITVQGSIDNTIGSQYVTIAGINTLQGNGDNIDMMYNHLVMIPGQGTEGIQHFGRRQMNSSETTSGGYVGSEMYKTHLGAVATSGNVNGNINQQLYAEFGSHLKTTRELLSNSINTSGYNRFGSTSGCSNSWSWYSCQAVLMSEVEVYGSTICSSSLFDTGTANQQLPLFRHSTKAQNNRTAYYWLKDVASSSYFCYSYNLGYADYHIASYGYYVRPRFVLAK